MVEMVNKEQILLAAGQEEEKKPWHWKQRIKQTAQYWKIIKWQAKINTWRNSTQKYCPECGSNDKTWGHIMKCRNADFKLIKKKNQLTTYTNILRLEI